MNEVFRTSVLQANTKSGKPKYWVGIVSEEDGEYYTSTEYWQGDGTHQFSTPKQVATTNVGKANERGGYEQAKFNVDSLAAKQQDKGYYGEGVEKLDIVLPMLANTWKDKKHLITYPVMVQPKLDGLRMLMKDGVAWTRKGKSFPKGVLSHILTGTNGLILDGELILDGDFTFQDTMKAAKKFSENSPKLVYHVFDVVNDLPFYDRDKLVGNTVSALGSIKAVETYICLNEEDLRAFHMDFIAQGYEGTIIRTLDGKYEVGHRSSDLLKMKDFDDNEFPIVDVVEGDGRDKGAAIFVCLAVSNFNVRPRGTIEWRREVFANKEDYIGKQLTVRYQGFSEDGIPRFPVGISIREEIQG